MRPVQATTRTWSCPRSRASTLRAWWNAGAGRGDDRSVHSMRTQRKLNARTSHQFIKHWNIHKVLLHKHQKLINDSSTATVTEMLQDIEDNCYSEYQFCLRLYTPLVPLPGAGEACALGSVTNVPSRPSVTNVPFCPAPSRPHKRRKRSVLSLAPRAWLD